MTLSPVFRSPEAVELLQNRGYMVQFAEAIECQREYVKLLHGLLGDVLDAEYLAPSREAEDDTAFLQENFFLTLFLSVFRTLGCTAERLRLYGLLDLCVKGLVVAGDNLFDDEAKMELPLDLGGGTRFASIMQLLCFDHLMTRVSEDYGSVSERDKMGQYRRALLSAMAYIGTLEGSEEGGVQEILPVEDMIEKVHRVRGGCLFGLAFVAPNVWEAKESADKWRQAHEGVAKLGTAFQIVDDVVDFEFDLGRKSHNVLAAWITHQGSNEEKAALKHILGLASRPANLVETQFRSSARGVLERARQEAEEGFAQLAKLGFWFPPEDAGLFVRMIAGDAGDERMDAIAAEDRPVAS